MSLEDYVRSMKKGRKIYYVAARSYAAASTITASELLRKKHRISAAFSDRNNGSIIMNYLTPVRRKSWLPFTVSKLTDAGKA